MARARNSRPAFDLEDVLVRLTRRIRRLEDRPSVRVGDWTIKQNQAGQLVAVNRRTGVVRVIAVP